MHPQERAQYLHQFVMHAALDAVDEQLWSTSAMHLGVVDRFNNLQAGHGGQRCLNWKLSGAVDQPAFCSTEATKYVMIGQHTNDAEMPKSFRAGNLVFDALGVCICDGGAHQVPAAARRPQ